MKKQLFLGLALFVIPTLTQPSDIPGFSVFETEDTATIEEGFNPEQITSHIEALSVEQYSQVAADIISTDQTTIENIKDTIEKTQHSCNQKIQNLLDRITTDTVRQILLKAFILAVSKDIIEHHSTHLHGLITLKKRLRTEILTNKDLEPLGSIVFLHGLIDIAIRFSKQYFDIKVQERVINTPNINGIFDFNHNGTFNQRPLLSPEEDRNRRMAVMD